MSGVLITYGSKHKWVRLPDGTGGAGVGIYLDRNYGPLRWEWRKKTDKRRPKARVTNKGG